MADNKSNTKEHTTRGPWSRFKKSLGNFFRRTSCVGGVGGGGGSKKTAGRKPSVADKDQRSRPINGERSTAWRHYYGGGGQDSNEFGGRSDKCNSDTSSNGNGGDPMTFDERIADIKLRRVHWLQAELTRKNERLEVGLCDMQLENNRLKVAVLKTEKKSREDMAIADALEAEHVAWQTVGRAQAAAETNCLMAENRKLKAALSESARWTDAAERRTAVAERRTDVAEQQIKRVAEQRSTLLSAVEDLQDVLASCVTDLQTEVLQTVAENLFYVLEATSDWSEEYNIVEGDSE